MKQFIIIISILFALSSCSDFLELSPKTELLEQEYFKTENDIFKSLTGVYNVLQSGYNDGSHFYVTFCADVLSDDFQAGGGDAGDIAILQVLDDYSVSPITNPSGLWSQYYRGINRANTVIEKAPEAEGDPETLARYQAEAYLLRTLYYYWIWAYYGNIIVYTETIADPADYYTQTQYTPDKVYDFLIKELDEHVIGKLPMSVSGDEAGRVTDALALTLKAKIVLLQDDKNKFLEIAQGLEEIINSGEYELLDDFGKIWLQEGENCKESIFEIAFSDDSGYGQMMTQLMFPREFTDPNGEFLEGWGFGTMAKDLAESYDPNDIRKNVTVFAIADSVKPGNGWKYTPAYNNTGYFLKKYAPRTGYYRAERFYFKNNIRIFRYSDVLLMASEANFRAEGEDKNVAQAQAYYNQVWKRARPTSTDPVPTVSLEEIYRERRLELAGEGHRYWDLLRTKKAEEVLKDKGWEAKNRYLPIPDSEITKASGSLKQNEGYK